MNNLVTAAAITAGSTLKQGQGHRGPRIQQGLLDALYKEADVRLRGMLIL